MADFYRWKNGDLILLCHVQPGAKSSGFQGLHGDRLKIRLKAAAVDGKANGALIAMLADAFGVRQSDVVIEAGQSSRQKTVSVSQPAKIPSELGIDTGNS